MGGLRWSWPSWGSGIHCRTSEWRVGNQIGPEKQGQLASLVSDVVWELMLGGVFAPGREGSVTGDGYHQAVSVILLPSDFHLQSR